MRGNEMGFPADIKGCMKDCILSLFWPRKDLVGFFEKHGCTKAEVSSLQIEGESGLKRHEIIDALFDTLNARPDNGLGPFRAMLQSLLAWSHFDPYYFDKLRKLDRAAANKNLEHLRQLQEIRDAKDHVPVRGVTAPVTLDSGGQGLLFDQAAMVGGVTHCVQVAPSAGIAA